MTQNIHIVSSIFIMSFLTTNREWELIANSQAHINIEATHYIMCFQKIDLIKSRKKTQISQIGKLCNLDRHQGDLFSMHKTLDQLTC